MLFMGCTWCFFSGNRFQDLFNTLRWEVSLCMELSKYSLKESILFSRIFAFYITIQTRYLNFSLLRFSTYLSLLLRKTVLLIRLCKYGLSMSLEIYGMYRVIFEVFNCSFTMFVNQYPLRHFLLYLWNAIFGHC